MRAFKHPRTEDIELVRVLHALSDPARMEIVRQLAAEGEATCSALNKDKPKSSMSHHYRVLRDSGLLFTRNEGTTHMNVLRKKEIDRLFPGLLRAVLAGKQ